MSEFVFKQSQLFLFILSWIFKWFFLDKTDKENLIQIKNIKLFYCDLDYQFVFNIQNTFDSYTSISIQLIHFIK